MSKQLKKIILFVLIITSGLACVPRKKLIYLQPDDKIQNSTFYYDDQPYRLVPEDVIALNVFSLTPGQFNFLGGGEGTSGGANQFLINKDGFVELPALGDVEVEGLTIEEAEDKIRNLLEDYLQSPLVRITLATPFTYHMIGEVNGPGQYTTVVGNEPNLMEAIARAGDLTYFADRENIRIVRKKEGEVNIYEVNILEDNVIGEPNYQIQQGDLILIDPLPARAFRENQLFVFSTAIGSIGGIGFLLFNLLRRR
jgi:polysaccharide export outer membrane protein